MILDVQGDWHEATRLYGSPLRRLLNPLNDALAPIAVRGADAVRTVSTQTTGLVTDLGVQPAAVFPSYVDAEAFLERPPAPLPETPRAVFVGVLERYKAFDTLVEAWRRAAPRVPGATLHVVGEGTMRDRLQRLLADLPEQTEWSPRLTAEGVSAAMDASWLVCLPSRSEGLPRVALEARVPRPRDRRRQPRRHPRRRAATASTASSSTPTIPAVSRTRSSGSCPTVPRRERLGAAARRTGEEWGVTPAQYAAKVAALVAGVLAG